LVSHRVFFGITRDASIRELVALATVTDTVDTTEGLETEGLDIEVVTGSAKLWRSPLSWSATALDLTSAPG
jgi:hypothetical protein